VFFTRIIPIPKLLYSHAELIYGLFFGLIVGSVVILLREVGNLSMRDLFAILVGVVLGGAIVTAVPTQTPDSWWMILGSGAVAICAMVVPGISGSFILLILGKYATVLDGLGRFDLSIILPFTIGAALGLVAFTRLLSWLLHRFERIMLLAISGFLLASLWVIWPFQERLYLTVRGKQRLLESTPVLPTWDATVVTAILFAIAGFGLVILITAIANRQK
jgi:putative membrane protein